MVHARITYGVAGCDIRRNCENAVLPRFGDGTNIVQPGDAEIQGSGGAERENLTHLCSARRDQPGTSYLQLSGFAAT